MGFNNVSDVENEGRTGMFQGKVVDNLDPLLKQRIKVEVPNLLQGPPELLPWVGPIVQSKFGMTESAVSVAVPVIGSIVMVQFQNGDLHYGATVGGLHTELSAELGPLETNYPARRGWYDPVQNWSYIDITPGMVEFQLHHKSGTQYTTYEDGRVHHLAVNLYHIEAPDIQEEAYNTHVVTSTTSTHTCQSSHTTTSPLITSYSLSNTDYTVMKTAYTALSHTIRSLISINHTALFTANFEAAETTVYGHASLHMEGATTEVIGSGTLTLRGGRIDLNP